MTWSPWPPWHPLTSLCPSFLLLSLLRRQRSRHLEFHSSSMDVPIRSSFVSCCLLHLPSTGVPARRTAWPAPCRPWQLTLPPNTVPITSQLVHVGSSLVCNPHVMRSVLPLSCAHLPSSCQPSANSSNTGLSQNTCNFEPLCPVDFSLSIQIKCAWGSTLGINAGNRAPWAAFGLLGLRVAGAH